ncbi:GGDEF domain-containing protein [Paraburkholderia bannensis]|uniref:GGDEF domain-containing protein n=1 Tax=Paraburkholderia bannensis TaxID=765414 RepID=UPI000693CD80|nr:sensor domain-containing diguanylate cyclase [Paraburkholderia bannensis]
MSTRRVIASFARAGRFIGRGLRGWSRCLLGALDARPDLISVAGVLCAIVVLASTTAWLTADRAGRIERAQERAQSVASLVAGGLSANMTIYDALLADMASPARDSSAPMTENVRERIRFSQAISHEFLDDAFIVGADGMLEAPPDNPGAARIDLHDRDYFQALSHGTAHGTAPELYVSEPLASRIRDGRRSVALARTIETPGHGFGGVAVLVVRLDNLQRFISRFESRDVDAVRVVREDGVVLANAVHPDEAASLVVPQTSAGAIERIDMARVKGCVARVNSAPLAVVVTPSTEMTLRIWQRQALWQGALALAFALTLAVGSMALESALRSRYKALEKLRKISLTDALTGLSNRRALDNRLDEEWRRASRKNRQLSILFIDIDRFKLFNDEYGHAVGDEVLRSVAQAIGSQARRAQDMAARYGGEEFAVVLPDTDAQEAAQIAERVRQAVQGLRIAHAKSDTGAVTVSVGCATIKATPGVEDGAEKLLESADAQLLIAKSSGRNRVCASVLDAFDSAQTLAAHV